MLQQHPVFLRVKVLTLTHGVRTPLLSSPLTCSVPALLASCCFSLARTAPSQGPPTCCSLCPKCSPRPPPGLCSKGTMSSRPSLTNLSEMVKPPPYPGMPYHHPCFYYLPPLSTIPQAKKCASYSAGPSSTLPMGHKLPEGRCDLLTAVARGIWVADRYLVNES